MAVITENISRRNFDLIADRIGAVLADEYALQAAAQADVPSATFWLERVKAFSPVELPAVNVSYNGSQREFESHIFQRGENEYFIDVHTNAESTDSDEGAELSNKELRRITGVLDYILCSPHYVRLGWQAGIIGNTFVRRIQVGRITEAEAQNTSVARITFTVIARETESDNTGLAIEEINCQATLEETSEGYQFILPEA